MVLAAGHYKQTQTRAFIEAGLNIVISIVFVKKYGIYGVAIGTLIAMVYRTIYLAYYLKRAILYRKFSYFVKHMVVDAVSVLIIYFTTRCLLHEVSDYIEWILLAIQVSCMALVEVVLINLLFYKEEMLHGISIIKKVLKKYE